MASLRLDHEYFRFYHLGCILFSRTSDGIVKSDFQRPALHLNELRLYFRS